MKTQQLCHEWANQIDNSGKCGSVFYEGAVIYSYGKHFPMAARAGSVTYVTTRKYSNTTAKHLSWVHQAIHGDMVYCHNPKEALEGGHEENINKLRQELEYIVRDINQRPRSRGKLVEQLRQEVANASKYIYYTQTDGKWLKPYENLLESGEYIAFAQEAAERDSLQREQREERERKKFVESVELFKSYKSHSVNSTDMHRGTFLRTNRLVVDSSLGMTIDCKQFKTLYRAWKAKKLHGKEINGYPILRATEDFVEVGCHLIPASEIESIKSQLS